MRRRLALIALLLPVAASADAVPPLKALHGFQPGLWQSTPIGASTGESHCIATFEPILTGGRPGTSCSFSVISDTAASGVVTYRCAEGRSGRTALRRDAGGIFTVDAQGLEGGLPFATRTEWRRIGSC